MRTKEDIREYERKYRQIHKAELREKNKKYYYLNRTYWLQRHTYYNELMKQEVLTHYGNGKYACVKCGYSENTAPLSIDHIDGNGAQQREAEGVPSGQAFWGWLKRNGFPEGYQTLCMNCQFIKRVEKKESRYQHKGGQNGDGI